MPAVLGHMIMTMQIEAEADAHVQHLGRAKSRRLRPIRESIFEMLMGSEIGAVRDGIRMTCHHLLPH
jgi:hypothetical protein